MQSKAYVEMISSQISWGFENLLANCEYSPPTETAKKTVGN